MVRQFPDKYIHSYKERWQALQKPRQDMNFFPSLIFTACPPKQFKKSHKPNHEANHVSAQEHNYINKRLRRKSDKSSLMELGQQFWSQTPILVIRTSSQGLKQSSRNGGSTVSQSPGIRQHFSLRKWLSASHHKVLPACSQDSGGCGSWCGPRSDGRRQSGRLQGRREISQAQERQGSPWKFQWVELVHCALLAIWLWVSSLFLVLL